MIESILQVDYQQSRKMIATTTTKGINQEEERRKNNKIPSEMEAAPRYKLPVHCLQLTMLTRGGRGDRDNFPQKAK